MYLWSAVDAEGEVLDILVQARRDKRAALKLMRKQLKRQGFVPQGGRDRSIAIIRCGVVHPGPATVPRDGQTAE